MASAQCSEETEGCTRLVFEAVNKNSVSLFESATNRYDKSQLLTSLAEYNEEGETPLAIAIKSNYVSVVEEIKTYLKDVLDYFTPTFCNILELKLTFVINQILHQFPIKEVIDILIHDDDYHLPGHRKWLMFIAKIVIKSISLTRQDKIILLELIGTALITRRYVDEPKNEEFDKEVLCGLECWKEAMNLRYFPTDGGDVLPKLPSVLVPPVSSSFIFGSAVEVATIEELDLLHKDFKWHFYLDNYVDKDYVLDMRLPCVKQILIQALLVNRRISTQEHLGHPHWLYIQSLLDFAGFFWEFEDSFRIKTYLFILEELNGFDPNLLPLRLFDVFIKTLTLLSSYFLELSREPPHSPRGRELNFSNLLIVTKWIPRIQCHHRWRLVGVVYRLVLILDSFSSRITSEEQQKLEKCYYDYFRDFPERRTTVLHLLLVGGSSSFFNETNRARLQTIKRILKFGADPNAIDLDGRTPLHYLTKWTQFNDMDESVPFFQVLLDAGAHLDTVADDGTTVLFILKKNLEGKVHPYFESLINTVFPLSCFCARVIRRHGIPFEDRLPPRLKTLVSSHSTKASIDLHQPRPARGCLHGIPFEDRLPPRLKTLVSSHSTKASIDLERKGIEEHKKRKI